MVAQDTNRDKDKGITVKKSENMPEWYSQVVLKSELASYSAIKGCMVIRPLGYSLWQSIMDYFNKKIQKIGVKNAYFPMFIPESFFKKEAEHAEGFSPEVAWVENKDADAKERLALRPTSETIMYDAYSNWIRSWRDLPLKINQWCNIIRWEVSDVKLFLRSREFLWQEGHCVYATEEETDREVKYILDEYANLCQDLLAVPVLKGRKTENEKFAGAKYTSTIEAFMPDGKALQMGTSHNLGQGFAKVFGIKYLGKDEKYHHPWQSSWGFSTRLIGGMVMLHSDDKGLILPPKIAPNKAVIIPILFDKTKDKVLEYAKKVQVELDDFNVILDDRDIYTSGWKFNEWELKGTPVRIEAGPKDLENNQVVMVRRDTGEKEFVGFDEMQAKLKSILEDIQESLLAKAKEHLENSIIEPKNYDEFESQTKKGYLARVAFCGRADCEKNVKEKTGGVTSRMISPDHQTNASDKCFFCDESAKHIVYFARNY